MGKLGGIALIVAAAAGLAACSAPSSSTPAPNETKGASIAEVAPSAAPIKAQATPSVAPSAAGENPERFLRSAKIRWPEGTPADEELLAGGRLACQKMRAGAGPESVIVVQGEAAGSSHNLAVADAARNNLCADVMSK
ncbi:hypothetical protein [Arthrobacter sp. R-11]|uniref:hypothetical protein n=1 Tax=Arthrobacter sp. R-11 TaxID=3404053 RepID=UPI003CF6D79D